MLARTDIGLVQNWVTFLKKHRIIALADCMAHEFPLVAICHAPSSGMSRLQVNVMGLLKGSSGCAGRSDRGAAPQVVAGCPRFSLRR